MSPIQNISYFKNIQKPHLIHRIFKLFRHENFLHRVRKGVNEQAALQKNFQFKDQIRSQTSDPSHISLRKSTLLLSHVSHKFVQECSQHVYLATQQAKSIKIVPDFCVSCFPAIEGAQTMCPWDRLQKNYESVLTHLYPDQGCQDGVSIAIKY